MTTLNNRLQLALLNRQKGNTALEKGFTLVELMIVIVIVGILSAVALPSFLGQQNKAKFTEATSKITAILKAGHAEYQISSTDDDAIAAALVAIEDAELAGIFDYDVYEEDGTVITTATTAPTTANVLVVGATSADTGGDAAIATASNRGTLSDAKVYGCVNLATGRIDVDRQFKNTVTTNGTAATTVVSGLDCS